MSSIDIWAPFWDGFAAVCCATAATPNHTAMITTALTRLVMMFTPSAQSVRARSAIADDTTGAKNKADEREGEELDQ